MPYIGVSPFNGVRRKHTYTATASQTSFSGAGTEGATLSYTDSTFVDVFQNGVKLGEADYTATSGTAIVLAQGASLNDLVEVVVYDVFSVADTVSKSAGGTFDGNVTMGGTLGVTGSIDLSSGILASNGSVQFVMDKDNNGGEVFVWGHNASNATTNELMRLSDSGNLTIANGLTLTDGNVTLASGHGIDFSATANNTAQSSSMASELLDDYEEGTWTPSYSVTSSVGDLGYYSPQGSYIKIGNQVTVWFYMSAYENNASGNFRVNLPFTSQNVSNYFAVASLTGTGWAGIGDAQEIHGRLSANATIINLNIVGNMNEAGAVTQANTDTSFILYGTITYKTA